MSKRKAILGERKVQLTLPLSTLASQSLRDGSLRTFEAVRGALSDAIKASGLTREVIAEEVTRLTGRQVSDHQINGWTAVSKTDRSIPLDILAALSVVTGTPDLAQAALECAGWLVLPPEEAAYYELGKLTAEDRDRTKKKKAIWEKLGK